MPTIYCMNCGSELEEGTRFCNVCGSPTLLGAGLVEGGKAQVACPSCGVLNDSGEVRCRACGAPLRKAVTTTLDTLPATRYQRYAEPQAGSSEARARTITIGALAVAAVVGALVGGLFVSGVFGRGSGSDGRVTSPAMPVSEEEAPVAEQVETTSAGVEVREGLADYSWGELSIIAREMTRCPTREEALAIASEYHLTAEDGSILAGSKDVEIAGIGTASMRLADVYHDNLANGEGKAGLTFVAQNLVCNHRMNATDDISGGWEGSELRSWLNGTVYGALDEELRTSIVAVDKLTNNVGHSTSASSVSSTIDYLWVPSMVELVGPIDWTWPSDPDNSGGYNSITNAEGTQYALFAQHGVEGLQANATLSLSGAGGPEPWWERTCSCSGTANYRGATTDGDPSEIYGASSELGVCLAFSL